MKLAPQPGRQWQASASPADIVIFGGAAGGGKTYWTLLEVLRHCQKPGFGGVIFRRESPQITAEGGLWDTARSLYQQIGARFLENPVKQVRFPSGAKVTFTHLQHEKDRFGWDGAQIPFLGWDELTHFTEKQFWYLQSRMRSTCGVKPYTRATCNPTPDSDPVGGWVNRLVSWWIDSETGYADPSRAGVIRWFYRDDDQMLWYDDPDSARSENPKLAEIADPTSFTFIPATLDDNPELMRVNPEYKARLLSLPLVEREQKMGGNWKIRHEAGTVFKREWFTRFVDHCPWGDVTAAVRYWDNAASDKADSDSTAGVGIAKTKDGRLYVFGVERGKHTTHARRQAQASTAGSDKTLWPKVELWFEQEGGSGGKDSTADTLRELAPYSPRFEKPVKNKVARASLLSAQAEQGNVYLVRGPWNHAFVEELCNFPSKGWHDDQVDAASGATSKLIGRVTRTGGSSGQRAS